MQDYCPQCLDVMEKAARDNDDTSTNCVFHIAVDLINVVDGPKMIGQMMAPPEKMRKSCQPFSTIGADGLCE